MRPNIQRPQILNQPQFFFFFFFFGVNKKIVFGVKGKIASESQDNHTTGAWATGSPMVGGEMNLDLFSETCTTLSKPQNVTSQISVNRNNF